MAQTIEKGIDSKSMGSVAQCDIRCYYDEVSVTSIAASLDDDTIPSSLLRSLAMLQMLPIVQVHCGVVSFQLHLLVLRHRILPQQSSLPQPLSTISWLFHHQVVWLRPLPPIYWLLIRRKFVRLLSLPIFVWPTNNLESGCL